MTGTEVTRCMRVVTVLTKHTIVDCEEQYYHKEMYTGHHKQCKNVQIKTQWKWIESCHMNQSAFHNDLIHMIHNVPIFYHNVPVGFKTSQQERRMFPVNPNTVYKLDRKYVHIFRKAKVTCKGYLGMFLLWRMFMPMMFELWEENNKNSNKQPPF